MNFKKLFVLVSIFVAGAFFTFCATKGEPSQIGELITIEQLKSLHDDDLLDKGDDLIDDFDEKTDKKLAEIQVLQVEFAKNNNFELKY